MRVHLFILDCSNLFKDDGTRENNGISRSLVIYGRLSLVMPFPILPKTLPPATLSLLNYGFSSVQTNNQLLVLPYAVKFLLLENMFLVVDLVNRKQIEVVAYAIDF